MDRAAPVDVRVSLVNTDNRELIRACLDSLPQACTGLRWDVTVVDNSSRDGSAEMIEKQFSFVRLLRNQRRRGFSANHNQVIEPAVASGSARYVLILNEDTVLDPSSVSQLVAYADERPQVGATGPVIRGLDGRVQPSYHRFPTVPHQIWATLVPLSGVQDFRRPGWLNGSCVLLRVEALRRIGALDERFFIFFEDADLGYRLRQSGYESAVCGQATIVHLGHHTVAKPAHGSAFERQMHRSRYLYFQKHQGPIAAHACSAGVRGAIALRALKAASLARLRGDDGERRLAGLLGDLLLYNPARPLQHELE